MDLTVDRFEGDIAVCETEDGGHIEIPREKLSEDIREGEMITERGGVYVLLKSKTQARRKRLSAVLKELMKE